MEKQIATFFNQDKLRSDNLMDYFLAAYFSIGLLLALYYDTWIIAIGVGGLNMIAYYSAKYFLKDTNTYQYVLGAVVGIFMAQFIYQMHGMFEMHFFAFIGSAILVIYRNWKLQIPLAIVVMLHHAAFGYLQFVGFDKIYFTQLEYMGMQTFLIHISLAATIFVLCGFWASCFKKHGKTYITQSIQIGKLMEASQQRDEMMAMAENLRVSNEQLQEANKELQTIFNSVEEVLFSMDMQNRRIIQVSRACKKMYGYSQDELMADKNLWPKLIHPEDKFAVKDLEIKLRQGRSVFHQFRIVDRFDNVHWIEIKISPTIDTHNTLIRVDGICNDITQKIDLAKKLAEEKAKQQQHITAAVITAQENERYFLGQELHDNINPILATAKLYIDCVLSDREDSKELLKESKGFITTAMHEIRTLSKSLVPPSLGEIGLTEAVSDMIEHIKAVNELEFITNWDTLDEDRLSDQLKLTIYRILQEQVNNILKHAHAKNVMISFYQDENMTLIEIKDDGIGFNTKAKRNGVGLQNIISRTELFDGKVTIQSEPGSGCQLIVKFNTTSQVAQLHNNIRA